MRCIRGQWRCIEVELNDILYALRGLSCLWLPGCEGRDSWALSTGFTPASQKSHDTQVASDARISAAEYSLDDLLINMMEGRLQRRYSRHRPLGKNTSGGRALGVWKQVCSLQMLLGCCDFAVQYFCISVHRDMSYSYIHGASNSTIKTTVCLPGCFKSRSNLIYFCMVWNTV